VGVDRASVRTPSQVELVRTLVIDPGVPLFSALNRARFCNHATRKRSTCRRVLRRVIARERGRLGPSPMQSCTAHRCPPQASRRQLASLDSHPRPLPAPTPPGVGWMLDPEPAHPRRGRNNTSLHEPEPPLLWHRSAHQDPIRLHPRPRRPGARPHPDDQPALPSFGLAKCIAYPGNREGVADHFEDRVVRESVAVELAVLDSFDRVQHCASSFTTNPARSCSRNLRGRCHQETGLGERVGVSDAEALASALDSPGAIERDLRSVLGAGPPTLHRVARRGSSAKRRQTLIAE